MQIHRSELPEITRFIEQNKHSSAAETEQQFRNYIRNVERVKKIGPQTRILEIGTGTGWFPVNCALRGISCKGLEISPQLVEHGKEFARRNGVDVDIELGNVETTDLGTEQYDVIVASSVFEHVEGWEAGLRNVYRALRPGGAFFFSSTNKFSLTSDEYSFPLYGWLPDSWRYRLRIARQGPDIMKLGIDFNQFRYGQLRRAFRKCGFSAIYDRLDIADPAGGWKKTVVSACGAVPGLKHAVLLFSGSTVFVCVK